MIEDRHVERMVEFDPGAVALDPADDAAEPIQPLGPDEHPRAEPDDKPGFVRQARRQAFWRSPPVRAALAVLAVLLGGLLGAQWAVHERDRATRY